MEPSVAVERAKDMGKYDAAVIVIKMDDDITSTAKLTNEYKLT